MKSKIEQARKLLKSGNEIGLHAYFNMSCWWIDKMFDVRPDGTFTFAPSLAELKGGNQDGTGTNSFGDNITTSTKFNQIGFVDGGSDITVYNCTEADYQDLIKDYCVYFINYDKQGLDLNGNLVTKGVLAWAEYLYNNLVENIGYSSTQSTLASRFSEDYQIPSGGNINDYYPDAAHLESGKIVFFDDTSNPNYNNAEYQKVGRFKKGLFKGCASCCNLEIEDRIIELAEAFCRHYFGMEHFTNFGRHGSRYVEKWWMLDGIPYDNRGKTILVNECQKVFRSRRGIFQSNFDILLEFGIKMTNHATPCDGAEFLGQVGLYYGQNKIRGNYFNYCSFPYGVTSYLTLLGYSPNDVNAFVPYSAIAPIINAEKNKLKWAYENAHQQVGTYQSNPLYMTGFLMREMDTIRACIGTGKIPALSLDTIANSPNTMYGVELLCQFCEQNDITIVPMGKAREIATTRRRETGGNLMPNPTFNQMLLKTFGGVSTKNTAYIPDGWTERYQTTDDAVYAVNDIIVGGVAYKEFAFTGGSQNTNVLTRIWGLPAGKYKFTAKMKSGNVGRMLLLGKGLNKDGANGFSTISSVAATPNYSDINVEFTIPEPTYNMNPTDAKDKYCLGYGDNLACIAVVVYGENGKTTCIYNPKLELIND